MTCWLSFEGVFKTINIERKRSSKITVKEVRSEPLKILASEAQRRWRWTFQRERSSYETVQGRNGHSMIKDEREGDVHFSRSPTFILSIKVNIWRDITLYFYSRVEAKAYTACIWFRISRFSFNIGENEVLKD